MSSISDFKGKSARAIVEMALEKAREHESFHALLSLDEKRALERADLVDAGKLKGRLAGVPFIAKDNFLTLESTTTAASHFLENFTAPLQATAIEKLEAKVLFVLARQTLMLLPMAVVPKTLPLAQPKMPMTTLVLPAVVVVVQL